jgi:hypothetical protein
MPAHEFFYLPCGNPDCTSRMILPSNRRGGFVIDKKLNNVTDIQLGRYREVSPDEDSIKVPRPPGAHEYNSYQPAEKKWPLTFACYKCGCAQKHEAPEAPNKERLEDTQSQNALSLEIKSNSIWPIEVKDNPPYGNQTLFACYTVAPSNVSREKLKDFIIGKVKPECGITVERENVISLDPIRYAEHDFPE